MEIPKSLIGKEVRFQASIIMEGNPVTGILIDISDEWINVKLTKNIAGINTEWYSGDEKQFRKSLINGSIKELNPATP